VLPLTRTIMPQAFKRSEIEPDRVSNVVLAHQQSCSRKEPAMDWNRVEGNWKQVKGKVKEQWGKLTDDDLDRINGKREQLEGKLQERYGYEKDKIRREIDDWADRQKFDA
jgi:uncharacterized protein YjbJ (UPF0337 family)